MITGIKVIKGYKFSELSREAKDYAKENFLGENFRNEDFSWIVRDDVKYLFPKSNLDIQYSLLGCQGDGLNIYGELNLKDILSMPDVKKEFTIKEIATMLFYMDTYTDTIKLQENRRYCYCIADRIDIVDDFICELENQNLKNINSCVLEKIENIVKKVITKLCSDYEDQGYDYLYNISDEEFDEIAENNGWLFYENGEDLIESDIDYIIDKDGMNI